MRVYKQFMHIRLNCVSKIKASQRSKHLFRRFTQSLPIDENFKAKFYNRSRSIGVFISIAEKTQIILNFIFIIIRPIIVVVVIIIIKESKLSLNWTKLRHYDE